MIKKVDTLYYIQNNIWDLIPAQKENEFTLYEPKVIYSRKDIKEEVKIENSEFSLKDKDWIVATMKAEEGDQVIDQFLTKPTIKIEALSEWQDFPSAYQFSNDDDGRRWKASRIPIWKISSKKSKGSLQIQTDPNLYATKLITHFPTLALILHCANTRCRVVPTLI